VTMITEPAIYADIITNIEEGDIAIFDPAAGPEEVTSAKKHTLDNSVLVFHLYVVGRDGKTGRFIVRGGHEPVLRWRRV
jgi:hypothetical protein